LAVDAVPGPSDFNANDCPSREVGAADADCAKHDNIVEATNAKHADFTFMSNAPLLSDEHDATAIAVSPYGKLY
jgi:hypothetical protein